jgi:threonyl-tRNA synthetase
VATLRQAGFRVELDQSPEKIGHKVRQWLWEQKVPLVGVVGDRELEGGGVTVRHRAEGELGVLAPDQLRATLERLERERR